MTTRRDPRRGHPSIGDAARAELPPPDMVAWPGCAFVVTPASPPDRLLFLRWDRDGVLHPLAVRFDATTQQEDR